MSIFNDINRVIKNTEKIYARRRESLYALSLYYSALALQDFRRKQAQDTYWENRTFTAVDSVFTDAFIDGDSVGWLIAHGVNYGVYLELANDGRYQALRPTINIFAKPFYDAAKNLYGGQ